MRSDKRWINAPGRKQSTKLLIRGDEVLGGIMWSGRQWSAFDYEASHCGGSETERLAKKLVEDKAKRKPVKRRIILDGE